MGRKPDPESEDLTKLEIFTIDEFSRWARVSRATTYRAIKDRTLRAHKLRGRTIIRRTDAERFAGSSPVS